MCSQRVLVATSNTFAMVPNQTFLPGQPRRSRSRAEDGPGSAAGRLLRQTSPAPRAMASIVPPPGLIPDFTAPGCPPSQALLAQLLLAQQQQNQLLTQQLCLLQGQHSTNQCYTDPAEVLRLVDPDLQPVLKGWMKDFKNTLQHHLTQAEIQAKYAEIESAGELQRPFADEASKEWQWPQAYKANAQKLATCVPVLGEGLADQLAANDMPFDICQAYRDLRRRHARECQDFVVAYQRQCAKYFADQASQQVQLTKLNDAVKTWFDKHGSFLSTSAKASADTHIQQFAELVFWLCLKDSLKLFFCIFWCPD